MYTLNSLKIDIQNVSKREEKTNDFLYKRQPWDYQSYKNENRVIYKALSLLVFRNEVSLPYSYIERMLCELKLFHTILKKLWSSGEMIVEGDMATTRLDDDSNIATTRARQLRTISRRQLKLRVMM